MFQILSFPNSRGFCYYFDTADLSSKAGIVGTCSSRADIYSVLVLILHEVGGGQRLAICVAKTRAVDWLFSRAGASVSRKIFYEMVKKKKSAPLCLLFHIWICTRALYEEPFGGLVGPGPKVLWCEWRCRLAATSWEGHMHLLFSWRDPFITMW